MKRPKRSAAIDAGLLATDRPPRLLSAPVEALMANVKSSFVDRQTTDSDFSFGSMAIENALPPTTPAGVRLTGPVKSPVLMSTLYMAIFADRGLPSEPPLKSTHARVPT